MNQKLLSQRCACYLVCVIVTTIPLIFGAVHPIVIGVYVFVILVGLGGLSVLDAEPDWAYLYSFQLVVPVVLIGWLIFQTIPLPLELVHFLSPARAERIEMVNELAGASLQAVALSDNGSVGIFRAFFFSALLLYYFTVRKVLEFNRRAFMPLFYCLVGVGVFEALYGLAQFINPQTGILWLKIDGHEAHGTIIYKNQYASLMNMIWPLALAGCVACFGGTGRRVKHGARMIKGRDAMSEFLDTKALAILLLAATLVMVLAILFSLSRGGILTMVLVGSLLIVLLPYSPKKKFVFLSVLVSLIVGYGALLGLDTIAERFNSIGESGGGRIDIYLSSLTMLWEHWLTGIGMGSYTLLSPVYLKGFPSYVHYDRMHNEYLELMIELGVPMALLLFSWLATGIVGLSTALWSRSCKNESDNSTIIVGIASLSALLGFLFHGMVDFGWRLPANLIYAATLLAIVEASLDLTPE